MILEPNATVGVNYASDAYDFWYGYIKDLLEEGEIDDEDSELCVIDAEIPVWESLPPPENITHEINGLGQVTGRAVYVGLSNEDGSPRKVNIIRGIPYAKSPIGELRFAPPEDVEPWDDTLDGVTAPPQCPELTESTDWDEDCLTLDVTFPEGDGPFPVVVFIGGYNFQSGRHPPSTDGLAAGTESVIVTFRYRVGAFGFLSTGDKSAPGNYGLQDIIAVLNFVNKYIKDFNGDPEKVTVMGYGTGGSIVNLLFHLKQADDLFHRAVSLGETGSARFLARVESPDPIQLGKELGCEGDNNELIQCLRSENVTAFDILNATDSMSLSFLPVVDGDTLTDTIANFATDNSYSPVDYLIGVTQHQAAGEMMMMMENREDCPNEDTFREHIGSVIDMYMEDPGPIRQVIAAEYLANLDEASNDDECPLRKRFMEFLQDFIVIIPTLDTAETHIEAGGKVYLFNFQQSPKYRSEHSLHLPPSMGPSRGDDIQYLFGMPYSAAHSPGCYGPEDREPTLALMRILGRFFDSG